MKRIKRIFEITWAVMCLPLTIIKLLFCSQDDYSPETEKNYQSEWSQLDK